MKGASGAVRVRGVSSEACHERERGERERCQRGACPTAVNLTDVTHSLEGRVREREGRVRDRCRWTRAVVWATSGQCVHTPLQRLGRRLRWPWACSRDLAWCSISSGRQAHMLNSVPFLAQVTAASGQLPRADSSSEGTAAWAQMQPSGSSSSEVRRPASAHTSPASAWRASRPRACRRPPSRP